MTWWLQGPSRSRCPLLTFLWFCATPWPGQNLWSSRSSSQCRHSRFFQVIVLKTEKMRKRYIRLRQKSQLKIHKGKVVQRNTWLREKEKWKDKTGGKWQMWGGGRERRKVNERKGDTKSWGTEKTGQPRRWGDDSRYSRGPTAVCRSFITVETEGWQRHKAPVPRS